MSDYKEKRAIPEDTLYGMLMDCNRPKTELEHFSVKRIQALEKKLAECNTVYPSFYQDSAGTIPAAAEGDPVGLVQYKIDIGEHNRLKQELAECKAKVEALENTLQQYAHYGNKNAMNRDVRLIGSVPHNLSKQGDKQSETPERKSLGESKNWGDE